ncbi:hypothetical protein EV646_116121 [Kribbella antiqua]|uniref:Uncharacterized protein n=1 Tax=Kribbella antiqua TaxID=2512217 RepID=A0A4V2S2M5_9ACTN|nr:hypothetical protein EV646_116121 [Kribbella antiqua]
MPQGVPAEQNPAPRATQSLRGYSGLQPHASGPADQGATTPIAYPSWRADSVGSHANIGRTAAVSAPPYAEPGRGLAGARSESPMQLGARMTASLWRHRTLHRIRTTPIPGCFPPCGLATAESLRRASRRQPAASRQDSGCASRSAIMTFLSRSLRGRGPASTAMYGGGGWGTTRRQAPSDRDRALLKSRVGQGGARALTSSAPGSTPIVRQLSTDSPRTSPTLSSSAWEQHGNKEGSIPVNWSQDRPNWCCLVTPVGAHVGEVLRFPKPRVRPWFARQDQHPRAQRKVGGSRPPLTTLAKRESGQSGPTASPRESPSATTRSCTNVARACDALPSTRV